MRKAARLCDKNTPADAASCQFIGSQALRENSAADRGYDLRWIPKRMPKNMDETETADMKNLFQHIACFRAGLGKAKVLNRRISGEVVDDGRRNAALLSVAEMFYNAGDETLTD